MAGGFLSEAETGFTGMKYYFNSYTRRGRFNCVAAVYGTIVGAVLLKKMTKKKKPAEVKCD
ncbi:Hypothetical predicted protein [Octopus vulgaris]|nr:Hypothetical predicted protein [Octopus vulgaris]